MRESLSIAVSGSGGAGMMTVGEILLAAAAEHGYFGFMSRAFGPQIRGGEAAALLRIANRPVEGPDDAFDVLLAHDWNNFDRFAGEIPLTSESLVLADPAQGEVPREISDSGATTIACPLKETAAAIAEGRPNMVALGVLGRLIGIPQPQIRTRIARLMQKKGRTIADAAVDALDAGYALDIDDGTRGLPAPAAYPGAGARLSMTGNEAAALGALKGGIRFVAAYPITPSTDMLEWMAPHLANIGGELVQAEDELAAITMCLGASFGGIPSATATSGPGLALMLEAIGLGIAAEVPVTIFNVMRGGPSTGIPTKSEQSDLNIAVYGPHGDAPHIVTAPLSLSDCIFTAQWTVAMAERLQCPAIMLSDQMVGHGRAVVPKPDAPEVETRRRVIESAAAATAGGYDRYAITEDGVSPMSLPGTPGLAYVADGLEHAPRGTPSTKAADHAAQLDKRHRKLAAFDPGTHWAEIDDRNDPLAVISFGTVGTAVAEACERLGNEAPRRISLRLIAPVQPDRMRAALSGVSRVLVVEQNHSEQLFRFLRAHYDLPAHMRTFSRPGPLPIRPGEIVAAIEALRQETAVAPAKEA